MSISKKYIKFKHITIRPANIITKMIWTFLRFKITDEYEILQRVINKPTQCYNLLPKQPWRLKK